MTRTRKILAWLTLGVMGAVAVASAAAVGLYAAMQTDAGRAWATRLAERVLSEPGGQQVSIQGLGGTLPQALRLDQLTIGDADGPWLTVASLAFDWRPWRLLRGEISAQRLSIDSVTVHRRPPGEGEGIGLRPIDLEIEALDVGQIFLASPVVGAETAFSVSGRASIRRGRAFDVSLEAERRDLQAGLVRLEAAYRPIDDHLLLNLQVEEPEGGTIARLLDLPDLPALSIGVHGEGPVARWRGRLSATASGIAEVQAEAALSRDAALRWDIAGDAMIESVPDTMFAAVWAGHHAFRFSGSWAAGNRLAVETLQSSSDRLSIDGHGRWDLARDRVSAWLSGSIDTALTLALADEVSISGPVTFEIAGEGSSRTPDMRAEVTAARLVIGGQGLSSPALTAVLQPRIARDGKLRTASFGFSGRASGAELQGDALHSILGGSLTLEGDGIADLVNQRVELHKAALKSAAFTATATGQIDLSDGEGRGELGFALADLSLLSPVTGIEMRGRLDGAAPVTVGRMGREIALDVSGGLSEFRVEDPVLQTVLDDEVRLDGHVFLSEDSLRIENLSVRSKGASLTGGLALTDSFSRVSGDYELVVPDAAVLDAALGVQTSGRAEAVGRLDGIARDPNVTGRFSLGRIGSDGFFIDALGVDYRLETLASAPRGRLEGKAVWREAPVRLATDLRFRQDTLTLDRLHVETHRTVAEGTLAISTDRRPLVGTLDLRAETLRPWLAMAELEGDGRLTGNIALSDQKGRQGLVLNATTEDMRLAHPEHGPIIATRVTVVARTSDLFGPAPIELSVQGRNLIAAELQLASFSADGAGSLSGADFLLQAEGRWLDDLRVEAAGQWSVAAKETTLTLARLQGGALGESFALRSPLRLLWSAERLAATDADVTIGAGRLRGSFDLRPTAIGLNAEATDLPLAWLRAFQGAAPKGSLSGHMKLSGSRNKPEGTLSVRAADLRLMDGLEPAKLELLLDGRWKGGRLGLSGRLRGGIPEEGIVTADLPLRFASDGLSIEMPATEPVSGTLRWEGNIAGPWALVPVAEHQLHGPAQVDLSLSGNMAAPRLHGSITLANARYENAEFGTLLRRLNAAITMEGGELRLSHFEADDGERGRITADGNLTLDPGRHYPFRLGAQLHDLHLLRRDDADGTISGNVAFEGNSAASRIHGKLATGRVEIRLVDRMPPSVVHLDVVEVTDGDVIQGNDSEAVTTPLFNPSLDVAVDLPRRVFVRGRGLDSEWEGELRVGGSVEAPQVTGELKLVRGFVTVVGKTLRLTRGAVTFPPGGKATPRLNVAATYNMTGYVVTVNAEGPATAPKITLSSQPPLPRDEIVSRILFDKSTTRLTAVEAVQLAAALSDLAGVGTGGVMDFARRTLGVDVLRVEDNSVNGDSVPVVSAGKYLTDRVYLDVRQGATPESGGVGVEVELTPNISLDSEVQRSGASNFGVKFKFDY